MAKISIIVPIFNVEIYLKKCLDSLVNQTLEDIEIILINDKSPDNSHIIMESYRNQYPDKIKCLYQPTNQKQGAARNVGIKVATGEFLLFVDSDDWIDLTMCEKLYEAAMKDDADLVYCDYKLVWEDEKTKYIMEITDSYAGTLNSQKRKALFHVVGYPVAKLIKRDLVIYNNIFFPENILYEDAIFAILLPLYANKLAKVNESLYNYLQREDSTVNARNQLFQFDRMKSGELIFEEMKRRGFYNEFKEEIDFCFIKEYYLVMLRYCIEKFDDPPINQMIKLNKEKEKRFPNYKQNFYIDKMLEPIYIKVAECNEKSSEYLIEKYNKEPEFFTTVDYLSFYMKYKVKVDKLLQTLHNENKIIAIWGAGQKGMDFLKICDTNQHLIDYVIDGNKNKERNILPTGHQIYMYENVKDVITAVLVINRYYFGEIYTTIKNDDKLKDIQVINLDNYLVFDML